MEEQERNAMRPSRVLPVTEPAVAVGVVLGMIVIGGAVVGAYADRISTSAAVGSVIGYIAAMFAFEIALTQWALRRFNPINEEAMSALGRGEIERAERLWRTWTRGRTFIVRALARHNLAVAHARRDQLAEAIRVHIENERHKQPTFFRGGNAIHLALCLVLVGEDEVAGWWLGVGEERGAGKGRATEAELAYVQAVRACRRGDAEGAVALLDRHWADFETHVRAGDMRVRRVMRAFAATSAVGP